MMSRFYEKILEDSLQELSDVVPLDVRAALHQDPISYFICAVGFEPRCTEIVKRLAKCDARIGRSVIVALDSNSDADRENGAVLTELLNSISDEVSSLNADSGSYGEELTRILPNSPDSQKEMRTVFDISVGANRLILQTMRLLIESNVALDVWYTEAQTYHPTQEEFQQQRQQWISEDELGTEKGVLKVVPSEMYAGEHLDSLPATVILFPSFRHERSEAVISHVDPALLMRPSENVIWVLGRPHLPEDLWRRDAMSEINRIDAEGCVLEASTFDYKDTYRVLDGVYRERWEKTNITLSPLGSKFQAIATSLFCFQHPDVRVLFATPKQYNTQQWSDGCRDTWNISFGLTKDLRQCLSSIGCISLGEPG